jgi:hypothetical protein
MFQVVDHLPSKCEALSSRPSNTKGKKIPIFYDRISYEVVMGIIHICVCIDNHVYKYISKMV